MANHGNLFNILKNYTLEQIAAKDPHLQFLRGNNTLARRQYLYRGSKNESKISLRSSRC